MKRVVRILLSLAIILTMCLAGGAWADEYREGEAIVVIRNQSGGTGVRTQAVIETSAVRVAESAAKLAGASVGSVYANISPTGEKTYALIKSDSKTTEQLMAELRENPEVLAVSPNRIVRTLATRPNDTYYTSHQWGLETINAPDAWDITSGDSTIEVAVVDTGIYTAHPDLISNLDITNSKSFASNSNSIEDEEGHGTHVSGIIGAYGDNAIGIAGVNWRTSIIMLKAMGGDGKGDIAAVLAALQHISILIQQQGVNIKAVNLSLGWPHTNIKTPGDLLGTPEYIAFKEFDSQPNAPVIVVAAGNDGVEVGKPHNVTVDGRTVSVMDGPASFIGLKNMIVVGRIDSNGSASDFSNWSGKYVHLAAPGGNIYSTVPGGNYDYMSGTSMAAPFVTGTVALLAAKDASLSATSLKRILFKTATQTSITAPGGSGQLSCFGLLDAGAALTFNYSTLSPAPSTATGFSLQAPSWKYVGETFYAAAEIEPWDSTATVTNWASSNTNVATVDESGFVRTHNAGRVTISANAGGLSGNATIEVRNRQAVTEDDGGVGGCSAGFPAFAVILALGFFITRKYTNKA